jgi:transposase
MTMRNDEGEKLRREIGRRTSTRGRLRRDLRERCEHYAATRSAAGASQKIIAAELGVSAMSVQRWLRARPATRATAMVPVRVVAPRALESASRIVITTPHGLRVDGLDLDAVCTVIARLG